MTTHNIGSLRSATDEQLVVAAVLGAMPAFDELVRRYRPGLTLCARSVVGARSVAEDIVQDTLLLAFRHLPSLDEPAAFPGWIRAICRNRAMRVCRGEKLRESDPDGLDAVVLAAAPHVLQPEARVEALDTENRLLAATCLLPDDLREPLLLRALEGWSVAQIAAFLDINDATVRGRLFRARRALERLLGDA